MKSPKSAPTNRRPHSDPIILSLTIMKALLFTLLLLVSVVESSAQVLHLSAGQNFESEFQNLPFSGFLFPNQSNEGSVFLTLSMDDGLSAGESLRLQIFENSFSEPPVLTKLLNGPVTDMTIGGSQPDAWQDLQGAFRLTMVSGSVEFTGISVNAVKETLVYSTVVPVPEPSALVLLALAAPLLLLIRMTVRGQPRGPVR